MPFSAVIGHTRLVTLLRRAVAERRVPQTLLFAGPAGVGKSVVALALTQAVNCPERARTAGASDACGTCPTCMRIARGQHSDVVWLDRGDEATIKIKTLRERILEVAGFRPFEAERRVYVIDPADALTRESQDALLKTLEEPPASALFILVSSVPDTLHATVQSRCRRLRFGALSDDDVARVLRERLSMDPAEARARARTAGGSVTVALGRADDAEEGRDAALAVIAAARNRQVTACLTAAAALAKHRPSQRARETLDARLLLLAAMLRDLARRLAEGADAGGDVDPDLAAMAAGWTAERAVHAYGIVTQARAALRRNASAKIVADWTALHL